MHIWYWQVTLFNLPILPLYVDTVTFLICLGVMTFSPSSSSDTFMPTMLSLWPLVRRNLTCMIIKTVKLQIFGCFSNHRHICIILPQRSPPHGSRYVFSPALMTREATEVRSCVGVISRPLTFPADLSPGESVHGVESPPNLRRRGRWLTAWS